MAKESVEERLDRLEHELDRAKAVNAIHNIMSKVQAYHTVALEGEISKLHSTRPDTKVHFGHIGAWVGSDAPDRAGGGFAKMGATDRKGYLAMHLMCNPIIEVAADGQTAKAVWIAAGLVAKKDKETGKPICWWEWNRYADDYIKENGEWKLWHHHIYDLFQCGWDQKWEDAFAPREVDLELMKLVPNKPDLPPTPLDAPYSPDTELPFIPIPEPYETWDFTEEVQY